MDNVAYQLATGTATSITLSTPAILANGYSKTFIASANNSASATTINGKSLYKPNTTTTPNLVTGKAYTVWYDLTEDCFFIKASAEGNAVAGNVLAGQIFSNDDDTGVTGTMPNRGTVTNTVTTQGGQYTIPSGYHSGSGKVTASFANLVAGNVKKGVNIGGVVGSLKPEIFKFDSISVPRRDSSSNTGHVDVGFEPNFVVCMISFSKNNNYYSMMKSGNTSELYAAQTSNSPYRAISRDVGSSGLSFTSTGFSYIQSDYYGGYMDYWAAKI